MYSIDEDSLHQNMGARVKTILVERKNKHSFKVFTYGSSANICRKNNITGQF